MKGWLNNEYLWYKTSLEMPCKKLNYCRYGQLVEEFPCHTEAIKYAIKHNLYVKLVEGKGWTKCKKEDKDASPDINTACNKVKDKYSCEVFGHDCPVYYMAELGNLDKHKLKKTIKRVD